MDQPHQEWIGWAIATWSLAGASFAFWTAANLIPRAVWHHRWFSQAVPRTGILGDRGDRD